MIKISAPSVELALLEAGKKLNCQCVDLEYEIVEKPSKGFLGIGKKDAVIVASVKANGANNSFKTNNNPCEAPKTRPFSQNLNAKSRSNSQNLRDSSSSNFCHIERSEISQKNKRDFSPTSHSQNDNIDFTPDSINFSTDSTNFALDSASNISDSANALDSALITQIKDEINELFSHLPLDIDEIQVTALNKNTIFVFFGGRDAALLIGERGYRYKAISYLLHNWISNKYDFGVRLEIEHFLVEQEAKMANYLAPIIEDLRYSNESFTTKTFDGILAYIALKELRSKLRNKSITLHTNEYGENYIIIT
ncbi:Jag N-terminal domain-containing protein [Helicobacter sp. 23-1044]